MPEQAITVGESQADALRPASLLPWEVCLPGVRSHPSSHISTLKHCCVLICHVPRHHIALEAAELGEAVHKLQTK